VFFSLHSLRTGRIEYICGGYIGRFRLTDIAPGAGFPLEAQPLELSLAIASVELVAAQR